MQQYQAAWNRLWQTLGARPADPTLLASLVQHYAQPQRKYHTLEHLDACLAHFDTLRRHAQRPAEIEVALWFHDAVYEVGAVDNEARSADWAHAALTAAGVGTEVADRVHALVMATCHNVAPSTRDQEILLDADLSILGAPPPVFDAYEQQIRAEYAAVPQEAFRSRRIRILQQFLDRERIYHTQEFRAQREAQARANLTRSISRLKG